MSSRRCLLRGLAAAIVAVPLAAQAQQVASPPVVGFLGGSTSQAYAPALAGFRQGLRENGYVEDSNIVVHYGWAEGRNERYPSLVNDLLRLNPRLLVAECGPALQAIREANRAIPVVVSACFDPVLFHGEIASVAHPGGRTTGFTFLAPEATGKRFELLKQIVPRLSRVAVLQSTDSWSSYWAEMRRIAAVLGVSLHRLEIVHAADLERAFAEAQRGRMDAMVVLTDGALTFSARGTIADLARRHRIPTVFDLPAFVRAGGLLSYGAPAPDLYRGAAGYVARILKGANPGELPVQQPTRFDLTINLTTAKALGLTIPPSLLLRAAELIE